MCSLNLNFNPMPVWLIYEGICSLACGFSVGRCNSMLVCWCYGVGYVKYYEFIVRTECDFGLVLRNRLVSFRNMML
jgi:hypothetical protein